MLIYLLIRGLNLEVRLAPCHDNYRDVEEDTKYFKYAAMSSTSSIQNPIPTMVI
jgi:hypothetical protein